MFQANILSSEGDHFENGNHKKSFYFIYYYSTDKDSYAISCTDVISSPKNPNDLGICQLEIIHKVDAKSSSAWHSGSQDIPEVKCFK